MQENYTKISKIKQLEEIGVRRATTGHLVGPADPTMLPADVAPLAPPHQSMGVAKKHTLQAFSTVDFKSVQDEGPKRGITWIAELILLMSVLKWTKHVHTHTLLHL
jgi:hypothetical protein